MWSLDQLWAGVYSEVGWEGRGVLTCVPEAPSVGDGIGLGRKARSGSGSGARAGAQPLPRMPCSASEV